MTPCIRKRLCATEELALDVSWTHGGPQPHTGGTTIVAVQAFKFQGQ
jgi:hypothetical protein